MEATCPFSELRQDPRAHMRPGHVAELAYLEGVLPFLVYRKVSPALRHFFFALDICFVFFFYYQQEPSIGRKTVSYFICFRTARKEGEAFAAFPKASEVTVTGVWFSSAESSALISTNT